MNFLKKNLQTLASESCWNYHAGGPNASEPAAWACLALASHNHVESARRAAQWLIEVQASDGSVGVTDDQPTPAWPTSLAILAWKYLDDVSGTREFSPAAERGITWCLGVRGKTADKQPQMGHDPTLVGWSWALDTHSWMEPTALFVTALKAAGLTGHPRTREGVRMIVDRLLPEGGCNYGNTMVLGQMLLPHVQPTGFALLALAEEQIVDPRIGNSLDWLEQELTGKTATASLCYALLGLAAHQRRPAGADSWLEQAAQREFDRDGGCYKRALITLAACDHHDWLGNATPDQAQESETKLEIATGRGL